MITVSVVKTPTGRFQVVSPTAVLFDAADIDEAGRWVRGEGGWLGPFARNETWGRHRLAQIRPSIQLFRNGRWERVFASIE